MGKLPIGCENHAFILLSHFRLFNSHSSIYRGHLGYDDRDGRNGRNGIQGAPRQSGSKGEPGSTTLNEEDLNTFSYNITIKLNESIAQLLNAILTLNQTLTDHLIYLESHISPTSI